MRLRTALQLLKQTFQAWNEDNVPRLGAALAYYSIFSIAPLVLLAVAVAGWILGKQKAEAAVSDEIRHTAGKEVADAITTLAQSAGEAQGSTWAIVSVVVLLIGAAGAFAELQSSLNTIWKVAPKSGRGLLGIIRDRFLSFVMVIGGGLVLLAFLVVSVGLSALAGFLTSHEILENVYLWQMVNWLVSILFITLLFGLVYKILPDVCIVWSDVWIGAVLTALLFTAGKHLLGLYFNQAGVLSPYGAAGSIVAVLLWIYYSSQILLFGAEFTRVYSEYRGRRPLPCDNAMWIASSDRALRP